MIHLYKPFKPITVI